jgi:hypothetical protein
MSPGPETLVLAGSEVSAILRRGDELVLRLPAGRLWPSGDHIALTLTCHGLSHSDHDGGCVGTVSEGEVQLGAQRMTRLPLDTPLTGEAGLKLSGDLTLLLTFGNGSSCRIQARALQVAPVPGAQRHTWLTC